LQNRGQKIFNKGRYVCVGGLDIQNFDKNSRFVVLAISIWGSLKFCLGGISPQKTPSWRREGTFVVERICFWLVTNSCTSYRCMTFQSYTRGGVTDRGKRGESPHLVSYM